MPSSDSIELSVAIDAGNTLAVLNSINENIKKLGETTKKTGKEIKEVGGEEKGGIFKDLFNFELLKRGFDEAIKFIKDAIKEAREAIKVNAVWTESIKKAGLSVKETALDVERIANANAFDDDQVKQIYNYGQSIGIAGKDLTKFVETAIDFSAASGKDLGLAMRTVGTLAKQGGEEFKKFADNVRGAGKEAADADGGFTRLGVSLKQFSEAVGTNVIVELTPLIYELNKSLQETNKTLTSGYEQRLKETVAEMDKLKNSILDQTLAREKMTKAEIQFGLAVKGNDVLQESITELEGLQKKKDVLEGILGTKKKTIVETKKTIVETNIGLNEEKNQVKEIDYYTLRLMDSMKQYGESLNKTVDLQGLQVEDLKNLQSIFGDIDKLGKEIVGENTEWSKIVSPLVGVFNNISNEMSDIITKGKQQANDSGNLLAQLSSGVNPADIFSQIVQGINAAQQLLIVFAKIVTVSGEEEAKQKSITYQIDAQNRALETQQNKINAILNKKEADGIVNQRNSDVVKKQIKDQEDLIKSTETKIGLESQQATNAKLNEKFSSADLKNHLATVQAIQDQVRQWIIIGPVAAAFYDGAINSLKARIKIAEAGEEAANNQSKDELALLKYQLELNKLKQEALIIDNQNKIQTDELKSQLADLKGDKEGYNKLVNDEITAYEEILAVTEDTNDKLKLEIEIQKLKNSLIQDQNNKLEVQDNLTSDIISKYAQAGLIDIQNISAGSKILGSLKGAGYSQSKILESALNLGLSSKQSLTNQTFNFEVNEASGETVESALSGRLSKYFGGR